jgi:hypothetical protein
MRIHNTGKRLYTHHGWTIKPGYNEVPEDKIEAAKFLLAGWPSELIDGGEVGAEAKYGKSIGEKDKEIADLKEKLEKAQSLLVGSPTEAEPIPAAPVVEVSQDTAKRGRPPGKK